MTPALAAPTVVPEILSSAGPLALGVLASGTGSTFEAIARAIETETLAAEIRVLVYNNPKAPVALKAPHWDVPAVLCDHRQYERREAFDRAVVEILQHHGVEWVVMAGWMRVATDILLSAFRDRTINIHPSLLPSFKGVRAVEQALAAGVKIAGCTAHLVRLDVDSGPILMQAAVPVFPDDTPESLHRRIQIQEHIILPKAIAIAASRVEGHTP